MAQKKIVKTEFNAEGNIKKKFTLWERAAARFSRSAERSFKRVSKRASMFSSVMKGGLGVIGVSRGLGMLQQGVGSLVTQFVAFDKAALGATVRFKDIGPEAADFNQQLKKIEASARDAGATTEFTAAQAADSLDFLARAGFTSAEAMGALGSMIDLATASGEEFATVADMSSDLLGAFGLNAKDTTQKIANLNRLNDVLVKSANSANVTIESMFETMKTAAPIGRTLGIELEEVAAVTAILGNAGIKGTEAGTALKNSFLNLSAATPQTVKMLRAIGVSTDDGTGNMRKFSDILADVGDATKEFGSLKVAKVLNTLFGKRAIAGAANLIEGIGDVREFEKNLKNAGKTSQLTADIMRTSLEAKLKTLGSAATEFGFKILEAFRGDAKGGLDSLTESIRQLDVRPIIEDLKIILNIATQLFKVMAAGAKFINIVGQGLGIAAGQVLTGTERREQESRANLMRQRRREEAARVAPNQAEAAAKAQQVAVDVGGTINVNAPAGTTAESTGPVGFNMEALGAN
jgi:TP901 family phage tail tape measure protein